LEYIGRNNFQFEIRGYRIDHSKIENVLLCYEGIKHVVVLARDHITTDIGNTNNSKYLVAYYVSNDKLDNKLIMSYLQNSLPEYMIPKTLVSLEKLPLTINGKLDKKELQKL
jgi:acyl-coenzyme A synthetase/AMP-(fatty) acid ligase